MLTPRRRDARLPADNGEGSELGARRESGEKNLRRLLCELIRLFYEKGWVSGTGGGICAAVDRDRVLMAPTGVHKERLNPSDFFIVRSPEGRILRRPKKSSLRLSECGPIFCRVIDRRRSGSVMHSHALSAVLAADLSADADRAVFEGLEMLKGIRGVSNMDKHSVPVIENMARESQLVDQVDRVLARPEFKSAFAVLVRDHGAYIWGEDVWEAKRHAEIYHFLFEAKLARAQLQGIRKGG